MSIEVITLILLVLTIAIGYFRKINTGLVALAVAFFAGLFLVKMSGKEIIAGFPTSLIFTLMGMTFLFSIAKVNKTMEMIALTIVKMARGNTKVIPLLFFILGAVLSALGPGPVVMTAIIAPLAMPAGKKAGIPDILTACSVMTGCLAGGLAPITASGLIAYNLGQEVGVANYTPVMLNCMLTSTIQFVLYYIIFKGYKLKKQPLEDTEENKVKLDQKQIITLIGIACVILSIVFLKTDTGLTAFCGGGILLLLGVADQNKAIAGISWSTILLVCGMAVLVNVVKVAGGIDMLSTALGSVMARSNGGPILIAMSGLMSSVSSASGVVMPTLIPTIPGIIEQMGGTLSATALLSAIVIGAHCVTLSPLSTLGAMSLASANEETNKETMFTQLMILGFSAIPLCALFAFLGLYNIF